MAEDAGSIGSEGAGGMPDIPLGKVLCPKCRGAGCAHCKDEGFVDALPPDEDE